MNKRFVQIENSRGTVLKQTKKINNSRGIMDPDNLSVDVAMAEDRVRSLGEGTCMYSQDEQN